MNAWLLQGQAKSAKFIANRQESQRFNFGSPFSWKSYCCSSSFSYCVLLALPI